MLVENLSKEVEIRRDSYDWYYDRLFSRLDWLEKQEKSLLEAWYVHHIPLEALSELTGWSEKTISGRVRRLSDSLLGGFFPLVVQHPEQFSPLERIVAYDHFILELGYRKIARRRHLGLHTVRQSLQAIQEKVLIFQNGTNKVLVKGGKAHVGRG